MFAGSRTDAQMPSDDSLQGQPHFMPAMLYFYGLLESVHCRNSHVNALQGMFVCLSVQHEQVQANTGSLRTCVPASSQGADPPASC